MVLPLVTASELEPGSIPGLKIPPPVERSPVSWHEGSLLCRSKSKPRANLIPANEPEGIEETSVSVLATLQSIKIVDDYVFRKRGS